jgi:class 3 adenylate cyclase
MALFGYPQAQENDAERAVRAALAIQRALCELNARNAASGEPELAARIGIDAGPLVVEAGGEVYGDAPNVAAGVQALAEPGAVMITARVQRQTAGLSPRTAARMRQSRRRSFASCRSSVSPASASRAWSRSSTQNRSSHWPCLRQTHAADSIRRDRLIAPFNRILH